MTISVDPTNIFSSVASIVFETYIKPSLEKSKLEKQRKNDLQRNLTSYSDRTYRKLFYLKTIITKMNFYHLLIYIILSVY